MKGICCICRAKIGAEKLAAGRVVASFRRQHYGLCPTCQGRTRADIARAYGQSPAVAYAGEGLIPEKGSRL
ncbi:MAG: hypothetical protein HGA96_08730 [Desulfobulbaceae bacterium]|nr:hypothetical protein [Desulfobulbaceae bacterium]